MFQSKDNRHVTRNVDSTVPKKMQLFLWELIDDQVKKGNEMDYFQKFEFRVINEGQEIIHSQERPKWNSKIELPILNENCLSKTIWVIDDIEYQTMLFPKDY
ncbi:DUF960 family protein [Carnobacterium jeotgali]|uniref:DUF960 family protein n=1 Tax=Carnobacterium jeotgali TaxID=545534 RepID=UPI0004937A56|nr:DUF960 family protein [Carnobacterium jeotgali]